MCSPSPVPDSSGRLHQRLRAEAGAASNSCAPAGGHDEPAMKGAAKKGKIRWTRWTDEILHQLW